MANEQKSQSNQEVTEADYSGYFQNNQAEQVQTQNEPVSPFQEIPVTKKFTRRAMVLLVILVGLILGQVYLMWSWSQNTNPQIPDGYQLVTPPNQPAYIEKVQ